MNFFDVSIDEWWKSEGKFVALHKITPLRFKYFSDKAQGLSGKRVLDIGCGGGILAEEFAKAGAVVTGIDLSKNAIDAAKEHAKENKLRISYINISAGELIKKRQKPFDAVVCSEILEHADDLSVIIADAAGLLKKGGHFFFSTINKTLKSKIFAICIAENLLGMIPKGVHKFDRFIKPSRLVRLLRDNLIEVEEIKGMSLDPISWKFKISNDISINYIGYGVKK